MRNKQIEILSPAGNLEIYKSVVGAGADAVYFGGDLFGARAFAKNFTAAEAEEAIRYGHLYDCSSYLTVNTLLKNVEVERKLYDYLKYYYEVGLDAVIVQDLGVMEFVRHYFPDLEIHASTQMTVTEAHGAKFLQEQGVTRVVTSREISIPEIRSIYDATGMEIETFVHGALCVSYSGQCLMSSMLGGRSGNRGRCAQPCRLPYTLLDDKKNQCKMPGEYVLSPKDLCGIDYVKELADAGVYSFKIEGRMKQVNYATGVVSMYRKYADAYLEERDTTVSNNDHRVLFDLGNRCGFTDTYFHKQNDKSMITYQKPSHEKKEGENFNLTPSKIAVNGFFYGKCGEKLMLSLVTSDGRYSHSQSGSIAEKANNNPTQKSTVEEKLKKTGNTPFVFEDLEIEMDENIFLPIGQINELRRNALSGLQDLMEAGTNRREALAYDDYFKKTNEGEVSDKKIFVTCSTMEQFEVACRTKSVDIVGISIHEVLKGDSKKNLSQCSGVAKQAGKLLYLMMPVIMRQQGIEVFNTRPYLLDESIIDGVSVSSIDTLGYLQEKGFPREKIHLDYRLYTMNNVSVHFLENLGYSDFCAPLELNQKELSHRINQKSFMPIYGRVALMITANCQNKNCSGCNHKEHLYYLRDRKNESFPVKNRCEFCYNEIYNSKVYQIISEMNILDQMNFKGYRLDFTLESKEEMEKVLSQEITFDSTKGHFKRGVD